MKKIGNILFIIMMLGWVIFSFAHTSHILAAEHTSVIRNVQVFTKDGGKLGEVRQWKEFRLTIDLELDQTVKKDDTTTFKIPDELTFTQIDPIKLTDQQGNLFATAIVDKDEKTITITYTDAVEKHAGIKGQFYAYVRIDHRVQKEKKTFPVYLTAGNKILTGIGENSQIEFPGLTPPVGQDLKKFGLSNTEKNGISYTIQINQNGMELTDVIIKDTITSPKVPIVPSSLKIQKGTWELNVNDNDIIFKKTEDIDPKTVDLTYDENNAGFTLKLPKISKTEGYIIAYDAKGNYDFIDGEAIENRVTLNAVNIKEIEKINSYHVSIAGGHLIGYVCEIHIQKTDENNKPLENAEFEVIREDTGAKVGTIKTDNMGNGKLVKLLPTNYIIRETKSPDGYILNTANHKVNKADLEKDKKVTLNITNKKQEKISIPVRKTWIGTPAEKVTLHLKANNTVVQTLQLTGEHWKDEFTNLDKFDQTGEEIDYTIEEEKVEGFKDPIITKTVNGFEIRNERIYNSIPVKLKAEKVLDGRLLEDKEFKFEFKKVPVVFATLPAIPDANEEVVILTNNQNGEIILPEITLSKENEVQIYTLKEIIPEIQSPQMTYDKRIYYITILSKWNSEKKVLEPEISILSSLDGIETPTEKITFKNTYKSISTTAKIQAKKELIGNVLLPNMFQFELLDGKGNLIEETSNDADGKITFKEISYDKPGIYTYTLSEKINTKPGYVMDKKVYTVKVRVENQNGQLIATVTYDDQKEIPIFRNVYLLNSTSWTPIAKKRLVDSNKQSLPMLAGEFQFELKDEQGNVISVSKNKENGEIVFDSISFFKHGVYRYTISEVKGTQLNMKYDTTQYHILVKVIDNGFGQLVPTVKVEEGDEAIFTNVKRPDIPEEPTKPNEPETPSIPNDDVPNQNVPGKTPPVKIKHPVLPKTGAHVLGTLWMAIMSLSIGGIVLTDKFKK